MAMANLAPFKNSFLGSLYPKDKSFASLSGPISEPIGPSPSPSMVASASPIPSPSPSPRGFTTTVQISSAWDNVNELAGKIDPMYSPGHKELWVGKSTNAQSWTGLRFVNVNIPKGSKIKSAKLELYPFKAQHITINLYIMGDKSPNSVAFSTTNVPSKRSKTTAQLWHSSNILWPSNTWQEIKSYDKKDMTSIVQEIVNQPDWKQGNALSFTILGMGNDYARKFVNSYSRNPLFAPKLTIVTE